MRSHRKIRISKSEIRNSAENSNYEYSSATKSSHNFDYSSLLRYSTFGFRYFPAVRLGLLLQTLNNADQWQEERDHDRADDQREKNNHDRLERCSHRGHRSVDFIIVN